MALDKYDAAKKLWNYIFEPNEPDLQSQFSHIVFLYNQALDKGCKLNLQIDKILLGYHLNLIVDDLVSKQSASVLSTFIEVVKPFRALVPAEGNHTQLVEVVVPWSPEFPSMSSLRCSFEERVSICVDVWLDDVVKRFIGKGEAGQDALLRVGSELVETFEAWVEDQDEVPLAVESILACGGALKELLDVASESPSFHLLTMMHKDLVEGANSKLASLCILLKSNPHFRVLYETTIANLEQYKVGYGKFRTVMADLVSKKTPAAIVMAVQDILENQLKSLGSDTVRPQARLKLEALCRSKLMVVKQHITELSDGSSPDPAFLVQATAAASAAYTAWPDEPEMADLKRMAAAHSQAQESSTAFNALKLVLEAFVVEGKLIPDALGDLVANCKVLEPTGAPDSSHRYLLGKCMEIRDALELTVGTETHLPTVVSDVMVKVSEFVGAAVGAEALALSNWCKAFVSIQNLLDAYTCFAALGESLELQLEADNKNEYQALLKVKLCIETLNDLAADHVWSTESLSAHVVAKMEQALQLYKIAKEAVLAAATKRFHRSLDTHAQISIFEVALKPAGEWHSFIPDYANLENVMDICMMTVCQSNPQAYHQGAIDCTVAEEVYSTAHIQWGEGPNADLMQKSITTYRTLMVLYAEGLLHHTYTSDLAPKDKKKKVGAIKHALKTPRCGENLWSKLHRIMKEAASEMSRKVV